MDMLVKSLHKKRQDRWWRWLHKVSGTGHNLKSVALGIGCGRLVDALPLWSYFSLDSSPLFRRHPCDGVFLLQVQLFVGRQLGPLGLGVTSPFMLLVLSVCYVVVCLIVNFSSVSLLLILCAIGLSAPLGCIKNYL